jgi:hypothetical protein
MPLESRQLYGPFRFEHLTAFSSVISRSTLPLLNISSETLPLRLFLSNSSSPLPFLSFTPLPLLSTTPSNSPFSFLSLPLHKLISSPSYLPLLVFYSFLSSSPSSPYPLISSLHLLTFSMPNAILSSPPFLMLS